MGLKFGEAVIELGFANHYQVEEALELQRLRRVPLGECCLKMSLMTREQVDTVLRFQQSDAGKNKRFGECATHLGYLTDSQVEEALTYQQHSTVVLGDLLVKLGYLSDDQRQEVLQYQLLNKGV